MYLYDNIAYTLKEKIKMSETVEMTEETLEEQNETIELDLKEVRKQQWRSIIEEELQRLIKNAALIKNKIMTAKTKYKKEFYKKKFDKINAQIRQYIGALQRLGPIITPDSEEIENGNNITT